jgi:hypothetical protein
MRKNNVRATLVVALAHPAATLVVALAHPATLVVALPSGDPGYCHGSKE